MGKKELINIRGPLMRTIRRGKFEEYAIVLLGERVSFSADVIDRCLPIHHDVRPESQ